MTITFFFNFLNHHQVLVADEMYKLLGGDFHFVATFPRNPAELKGGKDYSDRPYCLLAAESEAANREAHRLNRESDVCVFGAANLAWEKERATTGRMAFEVSERWLKKGWRNVFSPRLLQWWWFYQTRLRNKPFYRLCCSAFTAQDDVKLVCFKGRHFKWGYFTSVPRVELRDYSLELREESVGKNFVETSSEDVSTKGNKSATILWCARFLLFKHPELAIKLAGKLKEDGFHFRLDMIGDGEVRQQAEGLVDALGVKDCVRFLGVMPNEQVLQQMSNHDIFLFTSDRYEGWGAVVNEAMANGCCVVGSDAIGSVPYLVTDGATGMIFKSCDLDSLYEKVKYLLDNPEERQRMAKAGRQRMVELWSPENAAKSLLQLIDDLQQGRYTSILQGPCSKA